MLFDTSYDTTTATTLTELLDAEPEMGTLNAFQSGSINNIQSSNGQLESSFLDSASFAVENNEAVSSVPEASTLAMLGLGSLMVFGLARRNRKSSSVKTA